MCVPKFNTSSVAKVMLHLILIVNIFTLGGSIISVSIKCLEVQWRKHICLFVCLEGAPMWECSLTILWLLSLPQSIFSRSDKVKCGIGGRGGLYSLLGIICVC